MIKGQEKICCKIHNSTLDTFPRTLMLVGEKGAGKQTLCNYACDFLNLTQVDITDKLTLEVLEDINAQVEPYMYVIRINEISVKEENTILKFLEEPLKNSFIMLLADTEIGILQTILNRCQIWHLQHYSRDVLKEFLTIEDNRVLDIAHTPGMVKRMCECQFSDMVILAEKIINKISVASVSNTLTIANRLAFKEERDKFDVEVFVNILLQMLSNAWKSSPNTKLIEAYNLTADLNRRLYIPNIDRKLLFERFLIELRSKMKGELV